MKYIKIFLNWRIDVITILAALVLMLAMADSECVILFSPPSWRPSSWAISFMSSPSVGTARCPSSTC